MKTYLFRYGNSDIYGKINADISEEEADMIVQGVKNGYEKLEDDSDMKGIRKRIFAAISKVESVSEDDILWIYFPSELIERAIYGK